MPGAKSTFAKPPSRKGKTKLAITYDRNKAFLSQDIKLTTMDDIGWLVCMEASHEKQGFGALRFDAGRDVNRDMMVAAFDAKITLLQPRYPKGPLECEMKCELNAVWINGVTGRQMCPGADYNDDEKRRIARYVKRVLLAKCPHHTLASTWATSNALMVPMPTAMPVAY